MPIEIREIIIKTEISTSVKNQSNGIKEKELSFLKKQLFEEFKRIISESTKKSSYKR